MTLLEINNFHLSSLSDSMAVEIFRRLLWGEARRLGIPLSAVNVTSNINIPDGGIDASINAGDKGGDVFPTGHSGFQIKTGTSFSPWQPAALRGECETADGGLKSEIRKCLEVDGTYILVCFSIDPSQAQCTQVEQALKALFEKHGFSKAKVRLYVQNQLRGMLEAHPALALKVNRNDLGAAKTHDTWARQPLMQQDFKPGADQEAFLERLRDSLRNGSTAHTPVRVLGEPGIGKTRLVLEATREQDLSGAVIYCETPSQLLETALMQNLLSSGVDLTTILVVDECSSRVANQIVDGLVTYGSNVHFVSIYNEFEPSDRRFGYFDDVPRLGEVQLREIFVGHGVPEDTAQRWARECDGSPRVAHILAQNLMRDPSDLLNSGVSDVWDRYIASGDLIGSNEFKQRKLVLQHLSLFRRFGYSEALLAEAKSIASKVERADPAITWARFQEIVLDLKARKILQGEYTLYITPKMLQLRCWIDWWNAYGVGFDYEDFTKELAPDLVRWFNELFEYAASSDVARHVVSRLLSPEGPMHDVAFLDTAAGANFFFALANADPAAALTTLTATIGGLSRDQLLEFRTGRRRIVNALERVVVWRDLFQDGARLLLALGEAETETWSNNASGIFTNLFDLTYGPLASTEAAPEDRLVVLEEAFASGKMERIRLAIEACADALNTGTRSKTLGPEFQGLRQKPDFWHPKTYGELYEAYGQIWRLLFEQVKSLQGELRAEALDGLSEHAPGLTVSTNLADSVFADLNELVNQGLSLPEREKMLDVATKAVLFTNKVEEKSIRERWESLRDKLTGNTFGELLWRYVGTNVTDYDVDEDLKVKRSDKGQTVLADLADRAAQDPQLLMSEIGWLVKATTQNAYLFGYELGKRDENFDLLRVLLKSLTLAGKEGSVVFISGYFRAINEIDIERLEQELSTIAEDPRLRALLPALTWRSGGLTEASLARVLNLAKQDAFELSELGPFEYMIHQNVLSEDTVLEWIRFFLESGNGVLATAALSMFVRLFNISKTDSKKLPGELTFDLITHPAFLGNPPAVTMASYYWSTVANKLIEQHPEYGVRLAALMLENLGNNGAVFGRYKKGTLGVLTKVAIQHPEAVWNIISRLIDPTERGSHFEITSWLKGESFAIVPSHMDDSPALLLFPRDAIWKWVDEDVDNRAWFLASFAPKSLKGVDGQPSFAHEMLARYGNRDDVIRNFSANYSSGGWLGHASDHYRGLKESLEVLRADEINANVRRWLNFEIESLEHSVASAKLYEERRY